MGCDGKPKKQLTAGPNSKNPGRKFVKCTNEYAKNAKCPFFQWVDNATAGQQATSEEDPGEFYCCMCSQTKSNTIPHHNGACDSHIGEMER